MPIWLAMTEKVPSPSPAESLVAESKSTVKNPISIDEMLASLKSAGEDIEQITKLTLKEKPLVELLASLLKQMQPYTSSIAVSPSVFPIRLGKVTQAHIDSTGQLSLTLENGRQKLLNLSEFQNRDLMIAVVNDMIPKFEDVIYDLTHPKPVQPPPAPVEIPVKVEPPPQIPEIPQPQPPPEIKVETPIELASPAPAPVQEEPPKEEVPVVKEDENAKLQEITAETLDYLDQLGNEVFERSPVSMYFDDWMVNLRQVILSFESNEAVKVDEEFETERSKIFSDIEGELAKRLLNEAELEVSAKTLEENKNLLGQIDAGYVAQTKDLVVRGKSAIDFLIKNVQHLEEELAETEKIKVGYLHPLKRIAKEQKLIEISYKLSAAKKRLALALQNSAIGQEKVGSTGDVDTDYATQIKELEDRRKSALDFLTKSVRTLEEELKELEQINTTNPFKKLANEQKQAEIKQKLTVAKQRLALAEQSSNAEIAKLREEYEKKKQATTTKMQTLENEIKTKAVDNSAEARKAATNALANAVKALVQRQTAPAPAQPPPA
ncbi:MAG: hypothetical protein NWE95_03210 [Candidatus Bathyarchaeota archaeon]|nr:hypothetical protein [Candidatus Bathyarchaeota archaeon]